MPLHQLARKVLGEAGTIMFAVKRPTWGPNPSSVVPVIVIPHSQRQTSSWPPPGPPPLDELIFYSSPTPTGSQYGICSSEWVTVNFDKAGRVEGIHSKRHYGVAGSIYTKPGTWTYDEYGKLCQSVKSVRNYFPAPNGEAALEVVAYIDAIHHMSPLNNINFTYSCSGICGKGREALKWLTYENIDWVKQVPCPKMNLKIPSCYQVHASYATYTIDGTYYMNKVVIKNVMVSRYIPVP